MLPVRGSEVKEGRSRRRTALRAAARTGGKREGGALNQPPLFIVASQVLERDVQDASLGEGFIEGDREARPDPARRWSALRLIERKDHDPLGPGRRCRRDEDDQ